MGAAPKGKAGTGSMPTLRLVQPETVSDGGSVAEVVCEIPGRYDVRVWADPKGERLTDRAVPISARYVSGVGWVSVEYTGPLL